MLYKMASLIPVLVLFGFCIACVVRQIKRIRLYQKYLKIDNPYGLTGEMTVQQVLVRRGFDTKVGISSLKTIDPFDKNYYLTDEDLLVLSRPILHGKSILSFCIAGQLTADLCDYKEGNIDKATFFKGSSVIQYKPDAKIMEDLVNVKPRELV